MAGSGRRLGVRFQPGHRIQVAKVRLMSERRVLSDQEVADLVSGLRSLDWSWSPDEAEGIAERFGWKVESRRARSVRLDAGFGMRTGSIQFPDMGKVTRITVAACTPVSADSAAGRAFVQDAFAHVVAAATEALGEPTERIPGSAPKVRWRGEVATVGVSHSSVQVDVFLATNEDIDIIDSAIARELGSR
jgi:hypothetical protein